MSLIKRTKNAGNSWLRGKKLGELLSSQNAVCGLVFAFFLAVYSMTLCSAVFWWDSGELIANIAVMGLPHRPGFPIYVLLGKFLTFLPLGSFAIKVNFLSALFASLSLAVMYRIFASSARLFFPDESRRSRLVHLCGFFFLLVLGFTYSFWIQAVRAEVYSLNCLFFSLLLYLAVLHLVRREAKYFLLFFFLFGLGLGNHHLSLLSTLPALLVLILGSAGEWLRPKRAPFCVLFLLLGLSVYLYLPVRSLSHPALAWGEVESISSSTGSVLALDAVRNLNLGFLSHFTVKIEHIAALFFDQLTLPCFIVSLVGLFLLLKRSRRLLAFVLLLVGGNCAAVLLMTTELIPTNPDLHGYLILSIFGLGLSYGMGIFLILNRIRRSSSLVRNVLTAALGVVSLFPLIRHYPEADLSGNRIAHNYGLSVISHLEPNSMLFADNVNLNFILRELQYAEGIRQDVTVIDRGLLGFGWYAEQKRKELAVLFADIPRDVVGDPLFASLLGRCLNQDRPTYIEFTERDSGLVDHLVPSGYVFQASRIRVGRLTEEDLAAQKRWDRQHPFRLGSESKLLEPENHVWARDWDAQRVFALSFYRLGLFYEWKGMASQALDRYAQVRVMDPLNEELLARIRRLENVEALSEPEPPDSLLTKGSTG